jgi:hypothetical protein
MHNAVLKKKKCKKDANLRLNEKVKTARFKFALSTDYHSRGDNVKIFLYNPSCTYSEISGFIFAVSKEV